MAATVTIGLGTFNPTVLKSAVPPATQVQLFTGAFGVPIVSTTSTDPWATSVIVPSANQKAARVVINEPPALLPPFNCYSAFPSCVSSELSIVDELGAKVLFDAATPLMITFGGPRPQSRAGKISRCGSAGSRQVFSGHWV